MSAEIIADESVDFAIIRVLRSARFLVTAIAEDHPGWPDAQVLKFAFDQEAFLITEDKDFGELTYRFKQPNHGILLVRLVDEASEAKAAIVLEILQTKFDQLQHAFSVLETSKLRVRPLM